ncbi:hypothetical protein [Limisphaera sp. VF-2]
MKQLFARAESVATGKAEHKNTVVAAFAMLETARTMTFIRIPLLLVVAKK